MDTSLKLYFVDSASGTVMNFPKNKKQAELLDFTVSKTRMGSAPTIGGSLEYEICLDAEWEAYCHFDDVFVVFNNERYYLKATPASSKSNDKLFYKHELHFVSERIVLENVYMIDDNENQTQDILYSNNTQYTFFGNIHDFVERINQSMYFSNIGDTCMYDTTVSPPQIIDISSRIPNGDGYYVVVDGSVLNTDEVLITLSNNTVYDALKQIFEQFGVPYYFEGKIIHIGDYEPIVELTPAYADSYGVLGAGLSSGALVPYEYGNTEAMLTANRNNNTKQVYNRCSGVGSEDNIPYYYPNNSPSGMIHLEATPQSGSGLSESVITILNYTKLARLIGDILVYKYNVSGNQGGLHPQVKVDGQDLVYYNGHWGYWAYFDRDETTWSWVAHSVEIDISFAIGQEFDYLNVKINNAFQGGLNDPTYVWSIRRPPQYQSQYPPISVAGTTATLNRSSFCDNSNNLLLGTYSIRLYDWVEAVNPTQNMNPNLPYDGYEFKSLDSLLSDFNSYWIWYRNTSYYSWNLDSSGEEVVLDDYGIKIASGTTLAIGDEITVILDGWIQPQKNLMPACYRSSLGTKRFYPALNYPLSTPLHTPDSDLGDVVSGTTVNNNNYKDSMLLYYLFNNPYRRMKQREHIESFPEIKPSINGMTNNDGRRIDMFADIAFDTNDDNSGEYDINGNFIYNHPYFFVKLRKTDGSDGFNLFDHAIDEDEMTIAMTSGHCAPCEFIIGVDKETQKNLVQVDSGTGLLVRDVDGDVVCGRKGEAIYAQDIQNDTENYEVWIALKKNIDTYSDIMPFNDGSVQIRPTACSSANDDDGDTFVILHIELPLAYILAAEQRLTEEIIKWMHENNSEKFNLSLKFSRVYLGENSALVDILSENVKVFARYNGISKEFFVSSYSYAMKSSSPIPEITINGLVETVEELKSMSSGGFVNSVANHISENFGEIMMGINKPFTQIINQNNTSIINKIEGELPNINNCVMTDYILHGGCLIIGAGGRKVSRIVNGSEGQFLQIINGKPTWGGSDNVISQFVIVLEKSQAITDSPESVTEFETLIEEEGIYLILVQLQIATSQDGIGRSGYVVANTMIYEDKIIISSGKFDIRTGGQINMSAIAKLEKGIHINVNIEADTKGSYILSPISDHGNNIYGNASSIAFIRIL